ncbi:maleylacetoacetate isomerase [Agrobacterium fabrum]|uniref:Maleylacetoacetate isomerase n=1 Tax=Agrobacterium fabrum TaxID=1176649 RepID=A0A7Z7FS56_9HYPH|nr:maleylacetoacetate isomerase [Agrobacterium fabrum]SDK35383.1 maleylacetoacetate isomerase [Agrobacterium fabrum]
MFKLHNFFRSSTSTRLRAALNVKALPYDYVPYVLRRGDTRTGEYLKMNPAGLVPVLEREDGVFMNQSLAIIEWLEETHPQPPLLPQDADGRARVRALSFMIACEVHPLNNLRVLGYLADTFGADEEAQRAWFVHWVNATFDALETTLASDASTGRFCHGNQPSLADICLYAQAWNNRRFDIELSTWPTIARIFSALDAIPAFHSAAPPFQPDAS